MAFAAAHPERLLSLALIEPAWLGNEGLGRDEQAVWREFERIMDLPPEELMPAFVANQLRVLAAILDGIARGEFMVAPYEERGACTYCDFNDICPRPRTARERTRAPAPSGTPACQANQQTRVSAAARSLRKAGL